MDENTPAARANSPAPRGTARVKWEWIALGALLLVAAGYAAVDLASFRRDIERNERVRLEQQASTVEQLLDARLEATSTALAALRGDAPALLSREDGIVLLNERMRVMVSIMSGIRTFLLVNADGVAVASNRQELIGIDFREGERYRAIRGRPDANVLYVSPPFTTPLGIWALSLGRAVLDEQGRFDGYVLAIVDPEYWKLLLDSTRQTPDTSTAIIHGGGKVVYHVPDPRGAVGMNLAEAPDSAFARHIQGGRGTTFLTGILRTTGNEALIVFQNIRPTSTPSDGFLVASFSREAAAVFAPWRKELGERVALLGGAALLGSIVLLVFQRRRATMDRLEADHEIGRRRQEEELRESEARYRDLVELSPNAVLVNRADRIEFVSRAALELFGADRAEQLLGKSPFDLFHPDFHPLVRERVALLLSGSPALPFVRNRIVRLDGTTRDVEVTGALFQDGRGSAIQVILRDVTDQLRREEALRESEQRFRAIFDGATDGIVTADSATGRLLSCNAAFMEMTGYAEVEIRALRFDDLHEPQDLPEVAAAFAAMAAGRLRVTTGTRVRRKDGSVFLADIAAAQVTRGDQSYMAGFFRDVTEHRKADADLLAAQAQLAQSQKIEGIGRLAGGIAHDFNNILSVILSCAGFALEGLGDGDPVRDDVLEIEKGAKRAAALTRQLLAFSRRQVLQPVSMDLNQTLAGTEKMLRRIIGEDIDLVQTLAPDLGSVKADPGQVEQVLMNLAVNARDAMPEGGMLTIETANVDLDEEYASRHPGANPGPHVMMAITDSGVGMDERTRVRIFEPFFTTKGPGQGSGLGLSTVYGIVKQSGGSIYVYSELGQGTTFKIYLPREESPAAPAVRPSPPVTRSVQGETILVVEDDDAMREVITRVLAGAGYDVLAAANGVDGLATGEHHPREIHLLLTDVVMPQMGGRVFAERLARVRPGLKILYMSGYTDNAIVHHGVLDPGTLFIGKPFSQADLLAKVRDVLDGHEA